MRLIELNGADGQSMESFALRDVAIGAMLEESRLFDVAEFYPMTGNADSPTKAADASGGSNRALNADYVGVKSEPKTGSVSLKIYGDKILTDMAYERRSGSIPKERVRQLRSFSKANARNICNSVINGAGNDTEISGLKKLCVGDYLTPFLNAENGSQVILGNAAGAKASQQAFLHALDAAIEAVGPNAALLMNGTAKAYLKSIARERVQSSSLEGALAGALETYDGHAIINMGYNKTKDGLVIPNTETVGTSNDCTSVYVVQFGEKEDATFATNVGLVVKDLGLVGVHYTTLCEIDIDLALLSASAARRISGIRFA